MIYCSFKGTGMSIYLIYSSASYKIIFTDATVHGEVK